MQRRSEPNNSEPNNTKRARVTLQRVAAAAGVSKSTVSRILDERLPPSGNQTAQRVRRIAAELGYVRDSSASSLRRGSTLTIGVIVPRLTDTVMAMLYEAIARACAQNGRFAIVATTDERSGADRIAAESLLRRGVDGLILATAREDDDFPAELERMGVPHVLALRTSGTSLASVGDDDLGGYLAGRHLLDLGHSRFGIIAGPTYSSSARRRLEGFRKALAEGGLPPSSLKVAHSTFDVESAAAATVELMCGDDGPTAIFAINDSIAIGALSALQGLGLSVPLDVSLVGYNDIPIAKRLTVPLTTLRVPFDQMASSALRLLLEGPRYPDERELVVAPTLIPRQSTARPASTIK